jgi:hypothetical protein
MSRGDGTGPTGLGSMTGRAAGYCAGFNTPGFTNFGCGYYGRARGWWLRRMYRGAARWDIPVTRERPFRSTIVRK